jgi:hypothetical protein
LLTGFLLQTVFERLFWDNSFTDSPEMVISDQGDLMALVNFLDDKLYLLAVGVRELSAPESFFMQALTVLCSLLLNKGKGDFNYSFASLVYLFQKIIDEQPSTSNLNFSMTTGLNSFRSYLNEFFSQDLVLTQGKFTQGVFMANN